MYLMYTLNENGERVYTLKVFFILKQIDKQIQMMHFVYGMTRNIAVNHKNNCVVYEIFAWNFHLDIYFIYIYIDG